MRRLFVSLFFIFALFLVPAMAEEKPVVFTTGEVGVKKIIEGDDPHPREEFRVMRVRVNPDTLEPIGEPEYILVNEVDGGAFPSITLTEPGRYLYRISEVDLQKATWTCSKAIYYQEEIIEEVVNEKAQATDYQHHGTIWNEDFTEKSGYVEFTNIYHAPGPVDSRLTFQKMILGTPEEEETLVFELSGRISLKEEGETPVLIEGNGAGEHELPEFHYDKAGKYVMYLKEIPGTLEGCKYSDEVFTIEDDVFPNNETGMLEVTRTIRNKNGQTVDSAVFVNSWLKETPAPEKTPEPKPVPAGCPEGTQWNEEVKSCVAMKLVPNTGAIIEGEFDLTSMFSLFLFLALAYLTR